MYHDLAENGREPIVEHLLYAPSLDVEVPASERGSSVRLIKWLGVLDVWIDVRIQLQVVVTCCSYML